MNNAAKVLLEYEDFEAFAKTHSDVKTFCAILQKPIGKVTQMVLYLLSLLIDSCAIWFVQLWAHYLRWEGKIDVADMHKIIQSKNRGEAGFSVPAYGFT